MAKIRIGGGIFKLFNDRAVFHNKDIVSHIERHIDVMGKK